MRGKKNKLVCSWGVNDADYAITKNEVVNGKKKIVWVCPYYKRWKGMLERCFSLKYQEMQPTYKGCTVCEEWRYLSNFIKWVDSQPNRDWESCNLDKDFLIEGNKEYSPNTCVFIPSNLNSFIVDKGNDRGDYMIGVSYEHKKNPYRARCSSPFVGTRCVGHYPTELEAHKAWQAKKHEYALQLADLQEDERVAKALRERYAPDKDWTNN